MLRKRVAVLSGVGIAVLCGVVALWAQASLGSAQSFAVLGGSTVTNTGPSVIGGDVGVSPGSAITGFPPGVVVGGTIHAGDAVAAQAQVDVTVQWDAITPLPCTTDLTGQDLGGLILIPGVYCFSSSAQLTGPLVFDAQGNAGAVWVIKTGSSLTTASASSATVINGGNPCGVTWHIGSSATLGTGTQFIGNLIALTSITLTTGADINGGRALARNGAVTLDTNDISFALCGAAPPSPVPPPPVPTLTTVAAIVLSGLLALGGVATLRRRQALAGRPSSR
jgi:ice-binding like protein